MSVYIHVTVHVTPSDASATEALNLYPVLLTQLTAILHEINLYMESFSALKDWNTSINALIPYRMLIYSEHRPTTKQIYKYNSSQSPEIAAIDPGAKDGLVERQGIGACRRGELNATCSERFDTILVTHRSYIPYSYVLIFFQDNGG